MKFKLYLAILPLVLANTTFAEQNTPQTENRSTFHFSTQVNRVVEKDLMQATLYIRKTGKDLATLKKQVTLGLNQTAEQVKKYNTSKPNAVELELGNIRNYANYNSRGKVDGWVAEGYLYLKSKEFEAMGSILDTLPEEVAIESSYFSVSQEKLASLEDEMTLEIIKQFQHKAELIQKSLNAKSYVLSDVQLLSPNGDQQNMEYRQYAMSVMREAPAPKSSSDVPLEPGKESISATASGKVLFIPH